LTAEAVARDYKVSRDDQDAFSFASHQKAVNAISKGFFKDEIVPVEAEETFIDEKEKPQTKKFLVDTDEGPRADTSIQKLSQLKPVFDTKGSITAGNSSQTSDGASFVLIVSEKMLKQLNATPIARLVAYDTAALEPRIMGMGPVYAIPKVLKRAGMKQNDIQLIELNEAFASQSLAVIRTLGLNSEIINVNGGAIALGHPLGCSGAKLSVQLFNEMRRRKLKYGMVTMCVGTGQGAAGIFELLN
jgi:acetyl-CoA acyltransferase